MGDMTRVQYVMRRQAIGQELERMAPPVDPQLDKAAAILADFGTFWEMESSPAERRKLLTSLFERVWEQSGAITAVKPRAVFAGYFRGVQSHTRHHEHQRGAEGGSDGGQTHDLHLGSRSAAERVAGPEPRQDLDAWPDRRYRFIEVR